jgi:hypothetical protein
MSAGMVVGAVVGWLLVRRSIGLPLRPFGRPMLGGLLAAVVGAGIALWPAWQLRDAGLVAAGAGAFGTALLCLAGFLGVLRLVLPELFGELRALLVRPTATAR